MSDHHLDVDFMELEDDCGLEEDSNSELDVELENQYCNSKALKEHEPKAALASFERVLDLEGGEKGEWGFKSLKQMIKIYFKLSNFKEMMIRYQQLLTYIKSAVTRNYSEKSINKILDYISTSKNMELLQDFYKTTLEALKDAKNDSLWFKTNTKLGKLYYDRKDFTQLAKILKQLHQSCQTDDGKDDLKKETQLLEIYALEMQMYTEEEKNNEKLKALYEQSLRIKSATPHPSIMGVIRECGGKMHLREYSFEKAYADFFEAFKNYDESGSPRRTTCLKYLVLVNILMKSGINPLDSPQTKPFKNDPEVLAMTNLVNAYRTNDINEFGLILKQNQQNIVDDFFIREHIENLLRNIRTQVLINTIDLPRISMELNIDINEGETLLVSRILDRLKHPHVHYVDIRCCDDEGPSHHLDSNFDDLRATIDITHGGCSLETLDFVPLLVLRSEASLLRNINDVMTSPPSAHIAGSSMERKRDPWFIVNRNRALFDVKDMSPNVLPTVIGGPTPTSLMLLTRAFCQLYKHNFTLVLNDRHGIRQIPIHQLCKQNIPQLRFTIKVVNTPNCMYDYIYVPFVTTRSRVPCYYLDVFESDVLCQPVNYQVIVWAHNSTAFISFNNLRDILRENEESRDDRDYEL